MLVQKLNATLLQQFEVKLMPSNSARRTTMSVIEKWALQGVVVFLFAWIATLAAQWSGSVTHTTSSDRLAALSSMRLSTESVASSVNKTARGETVAVGGLSEGNE
jgi:hypothetical protein